MDARHGTQAVAPEPLGRTSPSPTTEEFVRFCYHRRRVGWPELYDEMCAVAARGVFRGWGFSELAEQGIRFTLSDLPALAAVAAEVSRVERERRRRGQLVDDARAFGSTGSADVAGAEPPLSPGAGALEPIAVGAD